MSVSIHTESDSLGHSADDRHGRHSAASLASVCATRSRPDPDLLRRRTGAAAPAAGLATRVVRFSCGGLLSPVVRVRSERPRPPPMTDNDLSRRQKLVLPTGPPTGADPGYRCAAASADDTETSEQNTCRTGTWTRRQRLDTCNDDGKRTCRVKWLLTVIGLVVVYNRECGAQTTSDSCAANHALFSIVKRVVFYCCA